MRVRCPNCGMRDQREFSVMGAYMARPDDDADVQLWHDFVHLRDNPAGVTRELWHHGAGCGAWLVVTRNTVTHEIIDAVLAEDLAEEDLATEGAP